MNANPKRIRIEPVDVARDIIIVPLALDLVQSPSDWCLCYLSETRIDAEVACG